MGSGSILWRLLKAGVGGAGAFLIIAVLIIAILFAKEYFFGSKNNEEDKTCDSQTEEQKQ